MLKSLHIQNYALIDSLDMQLSDGLSIITGETGAGKSILLGALGLVLGKRADLNAIKDSSNKCVIEAQFEIANYKLKKQFDRLDLDYEAVSIFRREILPSGKSRAFINDTPVTLASMQQLGGQLIDIHSQNDTHDLGSKAFEYNLLDAWCKTDKELENYSTAYSVYGKLQRELNELQEKKQALEKERDYNQFLYDELEQAGLDKINEETLEQSIATLENAERIQEALAGAAQILDDEEQGGLLRFRESKTNLKPITALSPSYEELYNRLESILIEAEDLAQELRQTAEGVTGDPEQLEYLQGQQQELYRLQHKHNLQALTQLLDLRDELGAGLEQTVDIENTIEQMKRKLDEAHEQLIEAAETLSEKRAAGIPSFTKRLEKDIKPLGMADAVFDIVLKPCVDFNSYGKDTIAYLFSANKGVQPQPLVKVASGGERSRIMLVIKGMLAQLRKLPTIIFDEIDTGVSGEIAGAMAAIMNVMSRNMQVISITHLPQIAAAGSSHYKVYKDTTGAITETKMAALVQEERIIEIAKMISGGAPGASALDHAKTLLNQ